STYGKGKTLMLGSYLGSAYEKQRDPALARFYAALLDWVGVASPVTVEPAAEVRYLESGRDTLLFAFNHNAKAVEPAIRLRAGAGSYNGVDLVTGKPVDVAAESGRIMIRGKIEPSDVWVVRLMPR